MDEMEQAALRTIAGMLAGLVADILLGKVTMQGVVSRLETGATALRQYLTADAVSRAELVASIAAMAKFDPPEDDAP